MKNFKKLLLSAMVAYVLMGNKSYAADLASVIESIGTGATKIVILLAAVLLLAAILFISYKSDSPTEIKPKVKKEAAPKKGKSKDTKAGEAEAETTEEKKDLKEELVDENTYEVEENEIYVEDAIEPVKIADDEDEVSLFESVTDSSFGEDDSETEIIFDDEESEEIVEDTVVEEDDDDFDFLNSYEESEETVSETISGSVETEGVSLDIDILGGSSLEEDDDFEDIEESSDGTMVFNTDDLNANLKTNIFAKDDEEEIEEVEEAEENKEEFDYDYDYDYDFGDEESKEDVVDDVEEIEDREEDFEDELISETESDEFKKPDDDVFADVEEEPTEFLGFTTIKSKAKKRGVSSWERTEYKLSERTDKIETIRPSANKGKNSASDFLTQMAKNLGGEEKDTKKATAKTTAKKVEKKEPAKKATTKKTTTKTTTKKTDKK